MKINLEHIKAGAKSGDWKIEEFEISEYDALLYNIKVRNEMEIVPGKYKRLMNKDEVIMSNTPMEINTHIKAIKKAKGNVLVAGLGLGMYLTAIADKEEVKKIVVIEKSKDVIKLVAPAFKNNNKIEIIEQDIFKWNNPNNIKFNFAWFDIWNDICEDNLEEMRLLKDKFKDVKIKMCWGEDLILKRLKEKKLNIEF